MLSFSLSHKSPFPSTALSLSLPQVRTRRRPGEANIQLISSTYQMYPKHTHIYVIRISDISSGEAKGLSIKFILIFLLYKKF